MYLTNLPQELESSHQQQLWDKELQHEKQVNIPLVSPASILRLLSSCAEFTQNFALQEV